jgi:hypothetical protein
MTVPDVEAARTRLENAAYLAAEAGISEVEITGIVRAGVDAFLHAQRQRESTADAYAAYLATRNRAA